MLIGPTIGHGQLKRGAHKPNEGETFRYSTLFADESVSEGAGTCGLIVDAGNGTFGSWFDSESVSEGGGVCGLAVGVGGGSSDPPTSLGSGGSAAEAVGVGGKLGTYTLDAGVPLTPGEVCACSLEIEVPDKPGEAVEALLETPALALHRVNHRVHNKGDGVIHLRVVKLVCEVWLPPLPSHPLWHPAPQCASELPQ